MLFPLGHFSPCSTHKSVHLAGMEALKALKAPSVEVDLTQTAFGTTELH